MNVTKAEAAPDLDEGGARREDRGKGKQLERYLRTCVKLNPPLRRLGC